MSTKSRSVTVMNAVCMCCVQRFADALTSVYTHHNTQSVLLVNLPAVLPDVVQVLPETDVA